MVREAVAAAIVAGAGAAAAVFVGKNRAAISRKARSVKNVASGITHDMTEAAAGALAGAAGEAMRGLLPSRRDSDADDESRSGGGGAPL
jgi:hypothetical protein